jgi:hypothetical protein
MLCHEYTFYTSTITLQHISQISSIDSQRELLVLIFFLVFYLFNMNELTLFAFNFLVHDLFSLFCFSNVSLHVEFTLRKKLK